MKGAEYPQNEQDSEEGNEANYLMQIMLNVYMAFKKGELTPEQYDMLVAKLMKQRDFIFNENRDKTGSNLEL